MLVIPLLAALVAIVGTGTWWAPAVSSPNTPAAAARLPLRPMLVPVMLIAVVSDQTTILLAFIRRDDVSRIDAPGPKSLR
jgi:hypothetical protein